MVHSLKTKDGYEQQMHELLPHIKICMENVCIQKQNLIGLFNRMLSSTY